MEFLCDDTKDKLQTPALTNCSSPYLCYMLQQYLAKDWLCCCLIKLECAVGFSNIKAQSGKNELKGRNFGAYFKKMLEHTDRKNELLARDRVTVAPPHHVCQHCAVVLHDAKQIFT